MSIGILGITLIPKTMSYTQTSRKANPTPKATLLNFKMNKLKP